MSIDQRGDAESDLVRRARDDLMHRDVVGQAKGILMERFHLSAQAASVVLADVSNDVGLEVVELAQRLADTGQLRGFAVPEADDRPSSG